MSLVTDWSKYPNFTEDEFRCKHTGLCEVQSEFMDNLQALRTEWGKPMRVNSGYRHWSHPIEARKGHKHGEHVQGRCADIGISGPDVWAFMALAMTHGFTRIGVKQHGNAGGRFIHVGMGGINLPEPAVWSYP